LSQGLAFVSLMQIRQRRELLSRRKERTLFSFWVERALLRTLHGLWSAPSTWDIKRRSPWLVCFLLAGSLGSLWAAEQTKEGKLYRFEESRVSMACTYTVAVYGADGKQLPLITTAALDEVDRIDDLMSNYKPDSPLSRINREAANGPIVVEPELFRFLERCVRYSQESEGAFDITVGPLMKSWGFFRGEGRIPWFFELWSVLRKVGYQHLILDAEQRTVQFRRSGMELDLGGIAKGYAVDRVVELLREYQIERALISAGGSTLYGLGTPPDSQGWPVKLRDPIFPHDATKSPSTVILKNQALSVSGSYEKFFKVRGATYSHIMDPRTGRPVENMLSVAVISQTGTDGDALDNMFYVQGVERGKALLPLYPGVEVFFFLPDGDKQWKMVRLSSEGK
jgi:thiamine biosynthesis lipoprotein